MYKATEGQTLQWPQYFQNFIHLVQNAENRPTSISQTNESESYTYDADGERVVRTAANTTTVFFEGVWEQTSGGARKLYYTFSGQVVAMRDMSVTPNVVSYLHGDHLGSVSVATTAAGTAASTQEFDPWGRVRSGGVGATSLNYTGQRLDATGLLYYHARYYNPLLARFISADSVVPGNAAGGMNGVALKGLTVDFHEPGFAAQIGGENGQPFWFQMSDKQRQQAGSPWGPANPQALNRYSYVQNRPLKYNDPSGHSIYYPDEPQNWQEWRAKAHEVVDRYYHKIEGQLSYFMNKWSEAVDSGVQISQEWINSIIKEAGLDPALQHLVKTALDIVGGGILSTAFKAPVWLISGVAELTLLTETTQQHQRIDAYAPVADNNLFATDWNKPVPGREFFPGGRAWSESYCEVYGGCVPAD